MEIYEEAELLLLGAKQCDRCGRLDTDSGQFLAEKDDLEPSSWYCSKCAPHVEARARHAPGMAGRILDRGSLIWMMRNDWSQLH
jgi:ribosomal protein S27AE